jgi:hypothetical protein
VSDDNPPPEAMGFFRRFLFAYGCFFRVLFDELFAKRTFALHRGEGAPAPQLPAREQKLAPAPPSSEAAMQLLALFQREGRFVDFLEEDVTTFSDADIGAAARVVHDGCRKALHDHAKLSPVRSEEEGAKISVSEGTPPAAVKLTGNVTGSAPFSGTLRHRGWRVDDLALPTAVEGHDPRYVAPAEVEL